MVIANSGQTTLHRSVLGRLPSMHNPVAGPEYASKGHTTGQMSTVVSLHQLGTNCELPREIPDANQKMLTQRIQEL